MIHTSIQTPELAEPMLIDWPDDVFRSVSLLRLCQTNASVTITKEDGTVMTYRWRRDPA